MPRRKLELRQRACRELTIFFDEHSHVVTHKRADVEQDSGGRVSAEAEGYLLPSNVVDRPTVPWHRSARLRVVRQPVPRAVVARHVARSVVAGDIARLIAWHWPTQHVGELLGCRAQC